MVLLDGKKVRDSLVPALRQAVKGLGFAPVLAILQVGDNERSHVYIAQKKKFAEIVGAKVEVYDFPSDTPLAEVSSRVRELNADASTNGIIIQLPLPDSLAPAELVETIDPEKDVDGQTALNLKRLMLGSRSGFVPATAKGVITLLDAYKIPIAGKRAVVVGRSMLVGKPLALALLARDATVTVCHSKTEHLEEITRRSDILAVAVGRPHWIGADYVRTNQTVIDIGISVEVGGTIEEEMPARALLGDVDQRAVEPIVGALSPVPGGVGPMTVFTLFESLVEAAGRQARI